MHRHGVRRTAARRAMERHASKVQLGAKHVHEGVLVRHLVEPGNRDRTVPVHGSGRSFPNQLAACDLLAVLLRMCHGLSCGLGANEVGDLLPRTMRVHLETLEEEVVLLLGPGLDHFLRDRGRQRAGHRRDVARNDDAALLGRCWRQTDELLMVGWGRSEELGFDASGDGHGWQARGIFQSADVKDERLVIRVILFLFLPI